MARRSKAKHTNSKRRGRPKKVQQNVADADGALQPPLDISVPGPQQENQVISEVISAEPLPAPAPVMGRGRPRGSGNRKKKGEVSPDQNTLQKLRKRKETFRIEKMERKTISKLGKMCIGSEEMADESDERSGKIKRRQRKKRKIEQFEEAVPKIEQIEQMQPLLSASTNEMKTPQRQSKVDPYAGPHFGFDLEELEETMPVPKTLDEYRSVQRYERQKQLAAEASQLLGANSNASMPALDADFSGGSSSNILALSAQTPKGHLGKRGRKTKAESVGKEEATQLKKAAKEAAKMAKKKQKRDEKLRMVLDGGVQKKRATSVSVSAAPTLGAALTPAAENPSLIPSTSSSVFTSLPIPRTIHCYSPPISAEKKV